MLLWEADTRITTYRWCNNYCADRAIDLGFDRLIILVFVTFPLSRWH